MKYQIENDLAVLIGLPLCYPSRAAISPQQTGNEAHFVVTAHGIER